MFWELQDDIQFKFIHIYVYNKFTIFETSCFLCGIYDHFIIITLLISKRHYIKYVQNSTFYENVKRTNTYNNMMTDIRAQRYTIPLCMYECYINIYTSI